MKTKEELLTTIIPNDDYWQDIFPKICKAMQGFSDQENARLTAINAKQVELIVYLKAVTISHSPDECYENKLLDELASLQTGKEAVLGQELIIDNNNAGEWTIDKISVKEKKTIDNCIPFDSCQGRNHCCTDKVPGNKCIGTNCGEFKTK